MGTDPEAMVARGWPVPRSCDRETRREGVALATPPNTNPTNHDLRVGRGASRARASGPDQEPIMFTQLFRVPDPYSDLSQLQRQVDALFSDWLRPQQQQQRRVAGPAFDVFDEGERFRLVADVPGIRAEDLEVEVTEDGIAIRGSRKVEAPEGFSVHRREREPLTFARSFTFPSKIDPEQVNATIQQGVLTITLGKRADAKPRSITVQTAA